MFLPWACLRICLRTFQGGAKVGHFQTLTRFLSWTPRGSEWRRRDASGPLSGTFLPWACLRICFRPFQDGAFLDANALPVVSLAWASGSSQAEPRGPGWGRRDASGPLSGTFLLCACLWIRFRTFQAGHPPPSDAKPRKTVAPR